MASEPVQEIFRKYYQRYIRQLRKRIEEESLVVENYREERESGGLGVYGQMARIGKIEDYRVQRCLLGDMIEKGVECELEALVEERLVEGVYEKAGKEVPEWFRKRDWGDSEMVEREGEISFEIKEKVQERLTTHYEKEIAARQMWVESFRKKIELLEARLTQGIWGVDPIPFQGMPLDCFEDQVRVMEDLVTRGIKWGNLDFLFYVDNIVGKYEDQGLEIPEWFQEKYLARPAEERRCPPLVRLKGL